MDKIVSGLILAAGASTRLGQPKQLLPFKGITLVGWTVHQFESCASLDEVVVVLGTTADEVRKQVKFGRSKIVKNLATGEGCSASYRVGIEAFHPKTEAMVVLLGDQPGVNPFIVEQVVSAWKVEGGKIVLANYQGRKGHPMLFARELFEQLVRLHGDKAVWKVVDQHPDWVREVAIDRPYPRDINTWEDYEAILAEETSTQESSGK
jgi:molybdenum cofactor cytidylyltransferase